MVQHPRRSLQHSAISTQHNEAKPKSRKTLPLINADDADRNKAGHAGVTDDKSFVFGVDGGSTPGPSVAAACEPMSMGDTIAKEDSRGNALKQHGQGGDRRDPSTPPRIVRERTRSESLRMGQVGAVPELEQPHAEALDIHQEGVVENHQHQAVDQRYLGKRLKIKEAKHGRGWHEGCNSLGKGKVSRDAADLDPSFGASALIQDDGLRRAEPVSVARNLSLRSGEAAYEIG